MRTTSLIDGAKNSYHRPDLSDCELFGAECVPSDLSREHLTVWWIFAKLIFGLKFKWEPMIPPIHHPWSGKWHEDSPKSGAIVNKNDFSICAPLKICQKQFLKTNRVKNDKSFNWIDLSIIFHLPDSIARRRTIIIHFAFTIYSFFISSLVYGFVPCIVHVLRMKLNYN